MSTFCTQLLSGIGLSCQHTMGGIKAVYIANFADVKSVVEEDGVIIEISMEEGTQFRKYLFRRNSASNMSSSRSGDDAAGTHSVTTNIAMTFSLMDTEKRKEMDMLSVAQLICIVEDRNGLLWMPCTPNDDYMSMSAGEASTGSTISEANQYSTTITGEASHFPYEVDKEAFLAVIE